MTAEERDGALKYLQETGRYRNELIQYRKDGQPVHVDASSITLYDKDRKPTGLLSVNRDIGERKQAEKALNISHKQLLSFIQQAPISIAIFDRNMHYISCSQRWVLDHGWGYTDLIGRSYYEIHPDPSERWKEAHQSGFFGKTLKN
ncbi:MAG TPA: hypothetical protein DCX53_10000, partial [Anaerolineae bacterium]|nr:hypothetical protein [Anaerolineae bacterium]